MFLRFLLVPLAFVAVSGDPPGGYYTTRYDHIDIENILNQKRLVRYYSACLLDKGPCTPQGVEFKRILPEAIKTNCLRCTEKQRVVTLRSIRRLKKEYPDVWSKLEEIWDPTGEYVKKLEESVVKPNPPRSPEIDPVIGDRFGGIGDPDSTIRTTTTTTTTTTAQNSKTTQKTAFTIGLKSSTKVTTSRTMQKVSNGRPFSSIGPNLIVPNPKTIIDTISNKVLETAGMVLNTVQNVFRG